MSDDDLNINVKELLLRIENTLKEEISGLKREVEMFHDRSVTRGEYETAMAHVRKEMERLERTAETNAADQKNDLNAFRQDIKDSQMRVIAVGGFLITVVQFILTYIVF